ncbi:sugar phosphate isomerase/epimerase family protein [Paludibaculum fermentans]|uniref:sugar phosphate isomerase/epimerase family protein n=1 Tax=Paludibaculum fermentans TaxID=1473598 RepID=UPI003EB8DB74
MNLTRRELGLLGLGAVSTGRAFGAAKPNSKFGGVQIGANVPYIFRGMPGGADDILKYCLEPTISLSALELRSRPVEDSLGAPAPAGRPGFPGGMPGGGRSAAPGGVPSGAPPPGGRPPLTPEQQAERKAATEGLRKWRLSQSMSGFRDFRRKYEDAGVLIQIVKFDGVDGFTDDELDYSFQLARELGANAISCEIPVSTTKRVGAFAEKHKMMVGYHGHGNLTDPEAFGRLESWEQAFSYSKYNGANVDIGHFFAANGFSPAKWIKQNHGRVTHVHLKDRKANNGPNVPWGEGDTPLKEILQMMKAEKYAFQATIEMEHPVPQGSSALAELAKCVEYCRGVLA